MDDSNLVILCDSREQRPLSFGQVPTEKVTLATGDYSCICDGVDYRDRIVVERKSVGDLLGCCGASRPRFEREMARLVEIPWRALVVEGSLVDLFEAAAQSKIPPKTAIASVLAWNFKFHLPTLFASNRAFAAGVVKILLRHGIRYHAQKAASMPVNALVEAVVGVLQPVRMGLLECACIFDRGREKHPTNAGFLEPPSLHLERARQHLALLEQGDANDDVDAEDHLAHAACRLLMAMQTRDRER